jgi:4-amino-4-deoxy-L-arabinose transferase-like glycosyltransferase
MSLIDRIAVLVSLIAFAAAAYVADQIYERVPHIEDEMALVWQARAIAEGSLTVPSPQPNPNSFLVPFVIDYEGQRFGKYPIGWPVVLAAGEQTGTRHLVNPLLTGLTIWLFYRLVKKLLDERTALLAAVLAVTSPFVLINAGALNSHPLSLLLTVILCIAWLDAFTAPNPHLPPRLARLLPGAAAALALGLLTLTRPWTAAGVCIPFFIHGLYLLLHGDRQIRLRLMGVGALTAGIASLYFIWQFAVTGSLLINPYTLWWPYDRVGFGPGTGLAPLGHSLDKGAVNTLYSLNVGSSDLFGWPHLAWIFLPFGLWAVRRNCRSWLVISVLFTLIGAYFLYWVPASAYGPRYYYEALFVPILLTAAGMRWLAGHKVGRQPAVQWSRRSHLQPLLTTSISLLLVAVNLFHYLPMRMNNMIGLYGVSPSCTYPLKANLAREAAPTLVFVHVQQRYFEYACLLDMNSPFLDDKAILAISRGVEIDQAVARAYPDRSVRHYYPDTRRLHEQRREIPPKSQGPNPELIQNALQ